ncbi:MAG: hypothetical protein A3C38_01280 [Planctomycetes bacterium RIFCSPHIGHO2_02_FULL_50_42]|nr:MAG: hypothetical protein A3C38_01280 [Planctomycetes bacterium RIFCSPHIGHO2_02_FULL_50_42]OHB92461.1 MAG: hypothetical protein A3E75_01690 [Planctomycetes bacterium RIFCSPHIGHO2_12_FULL_51_37]
MGDLVAGILRKTWGFTLPEVAAVVAITGTLAAVVVPVAIDQIENGRKASAKQAVDSIRNAIQDFFRDTGEWPDRGSPSTPNLAYVLRSGKFNARSEAGFTLFGTPTPGNVKDPEPGNTNWSALTGSEPFRVHALVNHLTLDGAPDLFPNRYRDASVNWNGPYLPQIFNDPWGRNYLVFSKAFTVPKVTAGNIFGWVISGGPNKTLETDVTSPILNNNLATGLSTSGDDIGVLVFQAREAIPGVSK